MNDFQGTDHLDGNVANMFAACPEFFSDFQKRCCQVFEEHSKAEELGLKIRQNGEFKFYVVGLMHASRQWRIAKSVSGIETSGISEELRNAYFGLMRVQLSVATFEKYSKLFNKDWWDWHKQIFDGQGLSCLASLREAISTSPAKKIKTSLKHNLETRWHAFAEGDDAEVFAVCVGLRHAYAHGEIWGAKELEPLLIELSDCILDGVKNHCDTLLR